MELAMGVGMGLGDPQTDHASITAVHRIDTAFGRQLHSSLLYASYSSSHPTTTKYISLIQQTTPFTETELRPSSAAQKAIQIAELTTDPSQQPVTVELDDDQPERTPCSAAKQSAMSNAPTSRDAIPISHHVRKSLFTDAASTEHATDPESFVGSANNSKRSSFSPSPSGWGSCSTTINSAC